MPQQSPQEAAERAQAIAKAVQQQVQGQLQLRGQIATAQGLHQMREELQAQLQALEEQRENVSEQLSNPMVSGANRVGLTERIKVLDGRIAAVDQSLAEVNSAIARSGGSFTRVDVSPRGPQSIRIPEEVVAISVVFMLCVLLPFSIAFARRIWRRSATTVAAIPQEVMDRLARLDQNLDAVALEVERIGESQRFLTRALAEQQLPAGQAERVEVASDKGWQRRDR